MKNKMIIASILVLSGCALTQEKVSSWSNDTIENKLYFYHNDPVLLAEANKRELFTSEELYGGIKEQRVFIGMSEKALFTSWGSPVRTNSHRSSSGFKKQHVYGGNRYVYVENGKVTSVSY